MCLIVTICIISQNPSTEGMMAPLLKIVDCNLPCWSSGDWLYTSQSRTEKGDWPKVTHIFSPALPSAAKGGSDLDLCISRPQPLVPQCGSTCTTLADRDMKESLQ